MSHFHSELKVEKDKEKEKEMLIDKR